MKKRVIRIIYILTLTIYLITFFTPYVNAGIWADGIEFLKKGSGGGGAFKTDTTKQAMGPILGMFYSIALGALIIATIILGIQFLIASSAEEKSKVKKGAVVVGIMALILFSAPTIWSVIVDFLSGLT